MKTLEEILDAMNPQPINTLDAYSMPYIDGVIDALKWVIEEDGAKQPFTDFDDEEE